MKSDHQGQAGTGGSCTTNYDTPTTVDMVRNVGGTLSAASVGFLVCANNYGRWLSAVTKACYNQRRGRTLVRRGGRYQVEMVSVSCVW